MTSDNVLYYYNCIDESINLSVYRYNKLYKRLIKQNQTNKLYKMFKQ